MLILKISKLKFKTIFRFYLTLVRITKNNKCWEGYEKEEPLFTVGRNGDWSCHFAKQYGVYSKLKINLACYPSILLLEIFQQVQTYCSRVFLCSIS